MLRFQIQIIPGAELTTVNITNVTLQNASGRKISPYTSTIRYVVQNRLNLKLMCDDLSTCKEIIPVHIMQIHLCHLISLLALPPSPNIEPSKPSFSNHPYSLTAILVLDGQCVYLPGQDHGGTHP